MDHTFPKSRSIRMDLLERFFHLHPSPSSGGASLWHCCVCWGSQSHWEFPFHLLVLQVSSLRVPSSSGSQTHLRSHEWNEFLCLNPFQRNSVWLRGVIHHLPFARMNQIYSGGGIQSWVTKLGTQWESSDAELEPHNVGRLSGVLGLL